MNSQNLEMFTTRTHDDQGYVWNNPVQVKNEKFFVSKIMWSVLSAMLQFGWV